MFIFSAVPVFLSQSILVYPAVFLIHFLRS